MTMTTMMRPEGIRAVRLTKREIEVLSLIAQGHSSKEAADSLYVSKRTVDFHLANIYDKLRFRLIVPTYDDLVPMLATLTRQLIPFNYVVPGESVNQLIDLDQLDPDESRPHKGAPLNEFSGPEYRIINFIADLPLRVERLLPRAELSPDLAHVVFVLTEFQIADKASAEQNESGASSHDAYKARQHERVRLRLFRDKDDPHTPD